MGVAIFLFVVAALLIFLAICAGKKQKKTAVALEENIKEKGFEVYKVVPASDRGMTLYVDDKNKKWFIQRSRLDADPPIYQFSDLLEFEVFEDGMSVAKGRVGSALIGGLLFGGAGAIVGASRSRDIRGICTSLQVRIRVKNLQFPEIIVPFISNQTKKDSFLYRTTLESAKRFAATLSYIQSGQEAQFSESAESSINQATAADEIEKLFRLKESGILTEAEFESKKKQLLNL